MMATAFADLLSDKEWTSVKKELALSPRQAQVVRCLLQAKADKQIAGEIGISVPTVRTYLDRLFHKFHVNDRVELLVHVFGCVRAASDGEDLQRQCP
jgi:DNA-binding CsgD family transcriptional regulator